MKHSKHSRASKFAFISLVLLLAGCTQSATIAEVNRDPARFADKEVVVTGRVVTSFGLLGQGVFELDDGTGRLWVLSENAAVPNMGTRVRVTGRVEAGVSFAGRSFASALRETRPRKDLGD